jgi:hypothetical protein
VVSRTYYGLLVAALGLAACVAAPSLATDAATETVADAEIDAAAPVDASAPPPSAAWLELATGRPGAWTPFEDGEVVRLQRGCQGSQHIFVSVRVYGAAEGPIVVGLAIRRTSDDVLTTAPYEVRLPFATEVAPGVREETGLMPVVLRASTVIEQEVFIDGWIQDTAGTRLEARRRAFVRWGPDDCG